MNGREKLIDIIAEHAGGLGCDCSCDGRHCCENCQMLADDILDAGFVRLPKIGDTLYWASPTLEPIGIKVARISYCDYGDHQSIYVQSDSGYGGVVGGNVFFTIKEAKHFYETAEALCD